MDLTARGLETSPSEVIAVGTFIFVAGRLTVDPDMIERVGPLIRAGALTDKAITDGTEVRPENIQLYASQGIIVSTDEKKVIIAPQRLPILFSDAKQALKQTIRIESFYRTIHGRGRLWNSEDYDYRLRVTRETVRKLSNIAFNN